MGAGRALRPADKRRDHARNCLIAYEVLRRHRIDPRPHRNPEVNFLLLSLERELQPAPEPVPVPPGTPSAPLKRDPRIRLFDMDEPVDTPADPSGSAAEDASGTADAPVAGPTKLEPRQGETGREETVSVTDEETPGFVGRIRALFR